MYCPKCGHEVGDYTNICPACGELLDDNTAKSQPNQDQVHTQPEPSVDKIPDYKVQAILLVVFSCILCCLCLPILALPFAIVALVKSNKVEAHRAAGNYDLAVKASEETKTWCWISFSILLATVIISIILIVFALNSDAYREYIRLWEEMMKQYEYYYNID